jgi:hypothetical protein
VLTPFEFACAVAFVAMPKLTKDHCTHGLGHVEGHNKIVEHIQTAHLSQSVFVWFKQLDSDITPALFTGDFVTGLDVVGAFGLQFLHLGLGSGHCVAGLACKGLHECRVEGEVGWGHWRSKVTKNGVCS